MDFCGGTVGACIDWLMEFSLLEGAAIIFGSLFALWLVIKIFWAFCKFLGVEDLH